MPRSPALRSSLAPALGHSDSLRSNNPAAFLVYSLAAHGLTPLSNPRATEFARDFSLGGAHAAKRERCCLVFENQLAEGQVPLFTGG
jgi:hypothetical protein